MQEEYAIEIDLRALIVYLFSRFKTIGIVTILTAALGLILASVVLPPAYEASTRIYVLNRQVETAVSYADYQISNQIIADYKVLITGQNVTKEVLRTLELDLTVRDLEKMILVDAPENTRVLQITVTDSDPVRAANIANTVREVASRQIESIMDVESVNLVYEAEIPEEPAGLDKLQVTLIAAVLGLVAAVAVLSGIYAMDDAIRTEEDVEQYLGVSVLGVIPAAVEMRDFARENGMSPKHRKRRTRAPEGLQYE